jgi:hypothetical protein
MECVDVSTSGFTEPRGWVVLIMLQCGRRPCSVVASQNLFENVGRRGLSNGFRPNKAVRIAVPNSLHIEVVCDLAAGQHGVELLPGLRPGRETVHGGHRDPLRGMHRGGVAQFRRGLYVGGWQSHPVPVAQVLDVQITIASDRLYGPAVTVFDPVGRCQPKLAVVAAGNDQLTDACPIAIGQGYLQVDAGRGVGESVAAALRLSSATSSRVGASMIESRP